MSHPNRTSKKNAAIGFGVAGVFVAGLMVMDVSGVGQMVLASGRGAIAGVALWVLHGVAFTVIQTAFASIGLDDDDTPRGGKMIPIKVIANLRRKR